MEESAEAPPAADEARRFRGSVPTAGRGSGWEPADTTVSAEEHAKKITTRIGVLWGSRTVTKMPAPWLGSPLANATVPRTVAPSFGTLRACEAGVRFEPLWAQLQKRKTPMWVSFFFVIAHRFCCLHSRTSQGRGSVRGEPLTGSPTRVQSPARGRRGSNSLPGIPRMAVAIRRNPASPLDLTRFAQVEAASSPVLRRIPKRIPHPTGWGILFGAGDEESAEAPPAAEEARRFRGSVPTAGRGSGWEPADTTVSAEEHAKKITTQMGGDFWSGRRGSNSLPRPWQGRALPDELRPQTQG